jgi:hypothetical protein
MIYSKEEVRRQITEIEARQKIATVMEFDRLEASRQVWVGRLANAKEESKKVDPKPKSKTGGKHAN